MAASVVAAVIVLEFWRVDLTIPISYPVANGAQTLNDTPFVAELIKGISDHGWFLTNPSLGAPVGQQLYDYPLNDANLQFVVMKALTLFSSKPGVVMNLYYLLGFALVGLSSFLVMRALRISAAVAAVCSVLFSLLPYHFLRGESHLLLSGYFTVPLGAYLVMTVFAREPLFARGRARRRWPSWLATRRSLLTAGICVVIGSTYGYYAVFTVLLIVAATAVTAVVGRSRATVATGAALIVLILGALAINEAPVFFYHLSHGSNSAVTKRSAGQNETDTFKLSQLLLPIPNHRLSSFAHLERRYREQSVPTNENTANLGAIASLGFLWLLALALGSLVGWRASTADPVLKRQRHAAAAAGTAFLIGTLGGISSIIAFLVTPQFRSWNRLSVFIGFFALFAVASQLDVLGRRLTSRGRSGVFAALLAAVALFGVLDQTSKSYIPNFGALSREYHNDDAFVSTIERQLPPGASVLQLPYVEFPEPTSFGNIGPYDLLRGYLHSRRLRWSAGAMKGRPADWSAGFFAANLPMRLVVPAVAATGFQGIYIERFGYGDFAAALEASLEGVLGAKPLVSQNNHLSFFSLVPFAERLRATQTPAALSSLRRATLEPLKVNWSNGFYGEEINGGVRFQWAARQALLTVANPSTVSRRATLSAVVQSGDAKPAQLEIRNPDDSTRRIEIAPKGTAIEHTFTLRPGNNAVELSITAGAAKIPGDPRDLRQRYLDPVLFDSSLLPFDAPRAGELHGLVGSPVIG